MVVSLGDHLVITDRAHKLARLLYERAGEGQATAEPPRRHQPFLGCANRDSTTSPSSPPSSPAPQPGPPTPDLVSKIGTDQLRRALRGEGGAPDNNLVIDHTSNLDSDTLCHSVLLWSFWLITGLLPIESQNQRHF